MKLVSPIAVTPGNLSSSNVAITETQWAAGTFTTGAQRYVGTDLYEVVASPSTATEPVAGSLLATPTWIRIGKINRYRMFDFAVGESTSVAATTIDLTIATGSHVVNAVALFEVQAASVRVVVTDPIEGVVYDRIEATALPAGIADWFAWFFAPVQNIGTLLFTDLPNYSGTDLRIVVTAQAGSDAAVGECVIGRAVGLGATLVNVAVGIEDFSRKERDDFGRFVIVERRFAPVIEYGVFVESAQIASTYKALADVRAKPCVYIGSARLPETVALGFFRDFSVLRTGPDSSEMKLTVEGLV